MKGYTALFPALWGEDHNGYMNLKYNKSRIVAIGTTAYRFRTDGKSLLADTFNLKTLEQRESVLILRMAEEIRGIFPRHDGVVLYGKDLREPASHSRAPPASTLSRSAL